MSRAGDGKARSEKRRATHLVAFRLTEEAYAEFRRNAGAYGYSCCNRFAKDICLRPERIPIGFLTTVRTQLAQLYDALEEIQKSPDATGSATKTALQDVLMQIEQFFASISKELEA